MPFKNDQRLRTLIEKAANENEIAKALESLPMLTDSHLIQSVEKNADALWAVAVESILRYDALETEVHAAREKDKEKKAQFTQRAGVIDVLAGFAFFTGIGILIDIIFTAFNHDAAGTIAELRSSTWFVIFFILFGLLTAAATVLKNRLIVNKRAWKNEKEGTPIMSESDTFTYGPSLSILEAQLSSLGREIELTITEKAIKPRMRAIINKLIDPSYNELLETTEAPGLSEVMNAAQTISTRALGRLNFLFSSMPGGSIGIAGPRGAGKSTLIQNYCGAQRTVTEVKGKKVIPVFTSAPVEYDTRDFILHLFTSTCSSFLKVARPEGGALTPTGDNAQASEQNKMLRRLSVTIRDLGFRFGLLFLFISSNILLATHPELMGLKSLRPSVIINALGLDAGVFFRWGLLFLTVSYFAIKLNGESWSDHFVNFIKSLNPRGYLRARRKRSMERHESMRKAEEEKEAIETPEKKTAAVARHAERLIDKIRFQQTYTTGWSGTLKAPIGLEGGMNNSTTRTEKPMTNPEIIYEFTEFIKMVPAEFQVVIGIDELDKMESEQHAQKFLNDIKSLFGLPRCFFLISVSENAMSNFERRGLPFRDVFDSSFDSMVYIDYFNADECQSLLSKRVIGKPAPFFYLAYCLSGGLPRDLIRAFRHIIEINRNATEPLTLASITASMITTEVHTKMRAVGHAARKLEDLPEARILIALFFGLQGETVNAALVKRTLDELKQWSQGTKPAANCPEKLLLQYDCAQRLCEEVTAYLYLMGTLLEKFGQPVTQESVTKAKEDGDYLKLATARQAMAVNPAITMDIVDKFRQKHVAAGRD